MTRPLRAKPVTARQMRAGRDTRSATERRLNGLRLLIGGLAGVTLVVAGFVVAFHFAEKVFNHAAKTYSAVPSGSYGGFIVIAVLAGMIVAAAKAG